MRFKHMSVFLVLGQFYTEQYSCDALATKAASSSSSNRVFVGGLAEQCTKQLLQESFTQFGNVIDVSTFGLDDTDKRKNPFAFVTFESTQSALDAISDNSAKQGQDQDRARSINDLYQSVETSKPIDKTKRTRSNNARQKETDHRDDILRMCGQTNLLFQVQSTHLERLKTYMEAIKSEHEDLTFHVEGSTSAVTRNMSLLFLSVSDPTELARRLSSDPILFRAVKKYYFVDKGAIEVDLDKTAGSGIVVSNALKNMQSLADNSFRVHAFPPSIQSPIIAAIEQINDKLAKGGIAASIKLDPRDFSHILSTVQVYKYDGRGKEERDSDDALVMAGVSPSFEPKNVGSKDDINDSAVNRAYYKLKEAMGRYLRDHDDVDCSMFEDAVALDCGSAPGGWSKYLGDELKCKIVYSVDPADLVIDLKNVEHMRMKIQHAMPVLREKGAKIQIFVSDMCLHEMEEQVNFLLLARDTGILDKNAFFVLTLKCTTGYSKEYFDGQAKKVLETLASKAETRITSTYHLFSNRSGERTIMGFIV